MDIEEKETNKIQICVDIKWKIFEHFFGRVEKIEKAKKKKKSSSG